MPSLYHKITRIDGRLLLVLCLVLAALPNLRGSGVIDDSFHQGEYFVSAISILSANALTSLPLTIHGALDYIPAMLAIRIWGIEHYFLPTVALFRLLNVVSTFLLIAICFELTKQRRYRRVLLFAVAVLATHMVGYRDLVLLCALYVFVLLMHRTLRPCEELVLLLIFGVLVAFGMHWSYDRGIAGALSLGVATLYLAYNRKNYFLSLATFIVTIFLMNISSPLFSLVNYVDNIKILVETSAQWSYGVQRDAVTLTVFAVLMNILAIAAAMYCCLRMNKSFNSIATLIAFAVLAIFMLKAGTNRADLIHIYWALWMPLLLAVLTLDNDDHFPVSRSIIIVTVTVIATALILAYLYRSAGLFLLVCSGIFAASYPVVKREPSWAFRVVTGLVSIAVLLMFYSSIKAVRNGEYAWINRVLSPPENFALVSDAELWVTVQLKQSNASCVFDLVNNGVIVGLANMPSCSRFVYPIYASKKYEAELISAVRKSRPSAIVYSSSYGAYRIDGKSMRDRYPELDLLLLDMYPVESCAYEYCVRYLRS